jgi:hypothetical protein
MDDEAIRKDIWTSLKMWDPFNDLDEEQQKSLMEYLFTTYGHLYREEKMRTEQS